MKKIWVLLFALALATSPAIYAQKGKNKGGGDKGKMDIKVKNDDTRIKMKSNGKNENIKIDIKSKGNHDFDEHSKGDHNFDGHPDNGWKHGPNKHEYWYGGNNVIWFFGPGDIYNCKGKNKKQRIFIYDDVCIRLATNIGVLLGLLGDVRVNLDAKKPKMDPERYKKIKIEVDLLDDELRLIDIKRKKIKLRLGVLGKEKGD